MDEAEAAGRPPRPGIVTEVPALLDVGMLLITIAVFVGLDLAAAWFGRW